MTSLIELENIIERIICDIYLGQQFLLNNNTLFIRCSVALSALNDVNVPIYKHLFMVA